MGLAGRRRPRFPLFAETKCRLDGNDDFIQIGAVMGARMDLLGDARARAIEHKLPFAKRERRHRAITPQIIDQLIDDLDQRAETRRCA